MMNSQTILLIPEMYEGHTDAALAEFHKGAVLRSTIVFMRSVRGAATILGGHPNATVGTVACCLSFATGS